MKWPDNYKEKLVKQLTVMFDAESKALAGVLVDGKLMTGVASVFLKNGVMTLLDAAGHDLLEERAEAAEEQGPSKAQLDVAAAFGFELGASS